MKIEDIRDAVEDYVSGGRIPKYILVGDGAMCSLWMNYMLLSMHSIPSYSDVFSSGMKYQGIDVLEVKGKGKEWIEIV